MSLESSSESYFYCRLPRPEARLRLLCFPYAGGGLSVFHAWPPEFPPEIEVWAIQYPGRERRHREPPISQMPELIRDLSAAMAGKLQKPFACFGNSLGALVAFELIRSLRQNHGLLPVRLFASACAAPHVVANPSPIHTLPEEQFVQEVVRRYQAIPDVVLQDAELLKFYLPALRADFSVLETYQYHAEPMLDCPISAFAGDSDATVPQWSVEPWRDQTNREFRLRMLPGNHFFIQSQRTALIQAIVSDLADSLK